MKIYRGFFSKAEDKDLLVDRIERSVDEHERTLDKIKYVLELKDVPDGNSEVISMFGWNGTHAESGELNDIESKIDLLLNHLGLEYVYEKTNEPYLKKKEGRKK